MRYEGAFTIIAIEVTALMMLQRWVKCFLDVASLYKKIPSRVRALYSGPGDRKVVALVVIILIIETAVNAWLMTRAQGGFVMSELHQLLTTI